MAEDDFAVDHAIDSSAAPCVAALDVFAAFSCFRSQVFDATAWLNAEDTPAKRGRSAGNADGP
jgi:hypothetical protein